MSIQNILFCDTEKTAIKVYFEDGRIEVHSWMPESETMIDLDGWTETDIEEASILFDRAEAEAREKRDMYLKALEGGKLTEMNLLSVIQKEWTKEELFELKLAIFELDEVKAFKGRKEKSAMRKSEDLVEILHYLWVIRQA